MSYMIESGGLCLFRLQIRHRTPLLLHECAGHDSSGNQGHQQVKWWMVSLNLEEDDSALTHGLYTAHDFSHKVDRAHLGIVHRVLDSSSCALRLV